MKGEKRERQEGRREEEEVEEEGGGAGERPEGDRLAKVTVEKAKRNNGSD